MLQVDAMEPVVAKLPDDMIERVLSFLSVPALLR